MKMTKYCLLSLFSISSTDTIQVHLAAFIQFEHSRIHYLCALFDTFLVRPVVKSTVTKVKQGFDISPRLQPINKGERDS